MAYRFTRYALIFLICSSAKEILLHLGAQPMIDRQVKLLDFVGFIFGRYDADVGQLAERTAVLSAKTYGPDSQRPGNLDGVDNVFGITRRADCK